MTNTEQKTVDQLYRLMADIKTENAAFRNGINENIEALSNRVDKKHLPVNLEQEILRVAQQSISESIKAVLVTYNSPLNKLVIEVVNSQSDYLKTIISDSFNQVIRTEDFKAAIVSAFSHKVARSIISNNDGLFDRVANELKQDSVFKAKMALAVSNVVNECLTEIS